MIRDDLRVLVVGATDDPLPRGVDVVDWSLDLCDRVNLADYHGVFLDLSVPGAAKVRLRDEQVDQLLMGSGGTLWLLGDPGVALIRGLPFEPAIARQGARG